MQRALAHMRIALPIVLDPCCGSGYLLLVGLLHGDRLGGLVGADIDPGAVALCAQNLALLDSTGLEARAAQLRDDLVAYGKSSHRVALRSAEEIRARLPPVSLQRHTFVADAADPEALRTGLAGMQPALVLTDVPYGERSAWRGRGSTPALLASLATVLAPGALVALATAKSDGADDMGTNGSSAGAGNVLTILRRR